MQRFLAFGAAWVVTAVVAVLVAWQGVGVVVEQVTDDRPAPLSAAEVQAELERPEATTSTTSPEATTMTTTSPEATTTTTTARPDRAMMTTTSPEATTTTTTARPDRATTTTIVSASATTTTTAAPAPVTRTYNLVGGSASLRFSPSGVTVLWANPNSGFEAEVEQEGSVVQVEFESESHKSRVEGWWDNGPRDRVQESDA